MGQYYLDVIVLAVNNVVGLFVAVRFFNHLFINNEIYQKIKIIGILSILFIATSVNIVFEKLNYNLFLGFIVYFLIAYFFYHGKIHIKVIVAIFVLIFSLITELITAILFNIIFGAQLYEVRDNVMHLFFGGIVSKLLLITFYLFDNIVIQVDENNQYKFREKQLLIQKDQYENVIAGYNQVKKTRHDMLGHLVTIKGYLSNNMKENAIEYIDKLHQEIDFAKLGILSKNVAIDAIINNRKSRASELGIKFIEELIIPPKLKIEDMDICIVLGNSLNNAIEACQRITDCDNNRIIKIKIKYKSEYLLIEVRNTYDINSIRMKNGKFVSSKTNRIHDEIGIGVSNIKSVVEKYDGLFQIEIGEEFFALKIMIPDKDII